MTKTFTKILIGLAIGIGLLFLRDCTKKFIPTNPTPQERLGENDKERIAVNDRGDVVKTVRGKDGNTKSQVAYRDTGAGETVITIDNEGNIRVEQQTHGFVFRPGICLSASRSGVLFGGDIQFYYFRNFGANVGITSTLGGSFGENVRIHVGGSYRLPFQSFRNTSVYIGYDTKREIQVGSRIRF